jgi:predicted RNA-binding protein with RPS1 domain
MQNGMINELSSSIEVDETFIGGKARNMHRSVRVLTNRKPMKKAKPNKPPSEEYQRFEKLAKQLIAVPKSEIDKRQAEYEKKEGQQEN